MFSNRLFAVLAATIVLAANTFALSAAVFTAGTDEAGQLGIGVAPGVVGPALLADVVSASAGYAHVLAALSDGTVWAWGQNRRGELGDGTAIDRATPVQVDGLTNVVAVAAGGYLNGDHSLALKADGTVWAWGFNSSGQLGDGTTTDRSSPVQVSGLKDVVAIAAGGRHSLALKADGTLWAWGYNFMGQLGDNRAEYVRSVPAQVPGLTDVTAIACGYLFSLALTLDGQVWAWGNNDSGQLGDGTIDERWTPVQVWYLTDVIAVGAGEFHSLAVKSDGTAWAWGCNDYGQLGNGSGGDGCFWSAPMQVLDMADAVAVTGSEIQSLALKSDGTVWIWGDPGYGDRACGPITQTPSQVAGLTGATAVAAGGNYFLVTQSDGTVREWGANNRGQLGSGAPSQCVTPVQAVGLKEATAVAAGIAHGLAVKPDGTVWAWGDNPYGQLGNGVPAFPGIPVQVQGLTNAVAVGAGVFHSMALASDGTVWTWGANQEGELGNGTQDDSSVPVQALDLADVTAVAAGAYHNLALASDGTVWAWGLNINGQLGIDATFIAGLIAPAQLTEISGVTAVAAGGFHSLAIDSGGSVWAWGDNHYGQLGLGASPIVSDPPVIVPGMANVTAVAAGWIYSLALASDKTVWAWGDNSKGQLGDGTTTQRNRPVHVSGLTDVVAVAAGSSCSLAIKSDGTVWAWGDNSEGQLGDGTTTQRNVPVQVQGLSGAAAIASGNQFSLFLAGGPAATPAVTGVWPVNGGMQSSVQTIVVGFDRAVANVSADDLVLSAGSVVSVEGSGTGPYVFAVTGLPRTAIITATLEGDIASTDGDHMPAFQWSFEVHAVGDVDGDGHVDVIDLLWLIDAFGSQIGSANYSEECDFNGDGTVDAVDLLTMIANWDR